MINYNLVEHIERHMEWSSRTFGQGERTRGIVAHIQKELKEVLQDPSDLTEWIDIIILAIDGAWRVGGNAESICKALRDKHLLNESRKWPDPSAVKDGEPT